MISRADNVESYVNEIPGERREVIRKIRDLCRQTLSGYEESMDYGMPAYKRNGLLEVAFASQKQHITLYVMKKDVLDEFRDSLSASSIGKGCVRFAKPEQVDFAIVERLLRRIVESESAPC